MPDLIDLKDNDNRVSVPISGKVELKDGQKLLLSKETDGRLVVIQMVDA